MANGKIRFGKQSGGQLALVFPDGADNTEVTFPESGELVNKEYADLKQSKSELAYDIDTSSYIPNTLASGAIIESGSNANGEYVKFADGTLICTGSRSFVVTLTYNTNTTISSLNITFPVLFTDIPSLAISKIFSYSAELIGGYEAITNSSVSNYIMKNITTNRLCGGKLHYVAIGKWK